VRKGSTAVATPFIEECAVLDSPAIACGPIIDPKETTMRLDRFVTGVVVGCAALVISGMSGLAGQTPQAPNQAATAKATLQSGMAAEMAAKCQAMMADQEKMMAEMKSADQRVDELLTKMNAASGPEKVDATAAVVNELVNQRRAMRDGMMKMQHGMMAHMMEHMQAGKDSMAVCPMMKQMGGMKH
jgi:hypothetical protein